MIQSSTPRQSGVFGDFVAAHAHRFADLLGAVIGMNPGRKDDPARSRQFINAVLIALNADDLSPLKGFFDLHLPMDEGDARIDLLFAYLEGFTSVSLEVIAQERSDAKSQLALQTAMLEELSSVERRLLKPFIGETLGRIGKMQNAAKASGSSLSITLHELRRPLTILSSYSQLLSSGMLGDLPEPIMAAIEGITSSTEMMVQLVNTLAEISRLEDPDDELVLEAAPLDEVVQLAVENIAVEAKMRDTEIVVDYHDPAEVIDIDRRRFILALTNILSNALKHTPPNTSINVTTSKDRGSVHIMVLDHGEGFPPEDADHLFEKYFRSTHEHKRKVPGTGLGLFIVKTVVERHNGRVVARSRPGDGAEFEIIMPEHKGGK